MGGFTENQAFEANERSGVSDRIMTWQAGRDMLPLVRQIALDVARLTTRMEHLQHELATLERNRRTLDWPQRSRRYQLEDEAVVVQGELRAVQTELEALGVALLDPAIGLVGFPTLVNERRAYFSWHPAEDDLVWWNYAEEFVRRAIPEEWTQTEPSRIVRVRSKSRRKG